MPESMDGLADPARDAAAARAESRRALRKKAMDLLARREHSVAELQRKLRTHVARRGEAEDAEVIDEVLEQLQADGLLSDARFTEAFVRYRAGNGYGPQRIQAELRERGVSEKMAADYLDAGDPEWFERARGVRRKRFGDNAPSDFKERARQARFLVYRGFTTDQARRAVDGETVD